MARAFFRSAPVSCVLFGLVLAAGIIDAVFIATLTSRHIFDSFSEALIPVAFLIFGTILLRSQGVLRVIGIGYLCGGLSWFLASIGIFGTVATTNAGFIAEFLGMNATIALIVWVFTQRVKPRESQRKVRLPRQRCSVWQREINSSRVATSGSAASN